MTGRRTGPVRSEEARRAILEATARQFAEKGWDHLTVEGIAADARVGKQTIYRWWGSRSALVAECLLEGMLLPGRLVPPDTGDIRADLTAWVEAVLHVLEREDGEGLIRSLISAAADDVVVGQRFRDSVTGLESIVGRVESAAGQTPHLYPGAPAEEIVEALVGALVIRALSRAPRSPGDAARIIDAVLGPR